MTPLSEPAAQRGAAAGQAWPRVSIVTPSFNQAAFLEATMRSVVSQDYPDLEYLVIDGGSTDGSPDVIQRHVGRLAHWVSEPDRGQADAINKGWRRCTGEILAYLNSDDVYTPGAVARAAAYMIEHPDADLIYSDCAFIDAAGRPGAAVAHVPEFSLAWLLRNPIPQPTMFFRRRLLDRVGLLDDGLHYTLDWDFCLRAAAAGAVIRRVDGPPLAAFRAWEGQKTAGQFDRQIEEQLRIRDRLLARRWWSAETVGAVAFSKAWVFLWPAYEAYVRGEMPLARTYLRRAARQSPRMMLHPSFIGLYARTLLGRRVAGTLRRMRGSAVRWGRT